MARKRNINLADYDWLSILLYLALVVTGIVMIYTVDYYHSNGQNIFHGYHVKQAFWFGISLISILLLSLVEKKFIREWSSLFYLSGLLLLAGLFIAGKEVSGARSWYSFGIFSFQPSELAKLTTALGLAKLINEPGFNLRSLRDLFKAVILIAVPALLILLQPDLGTTLLFGAFVLVLFREGMSAALLGITVWAIVVFILALYFPLRPIIIWTSVTGLTVIAVIYAKIKKHRTAPVALTAGFVMMTIGWAWASQFAFRHLLKPHQQKRIEIILGKIHDVKGSGYHLRQSLIAVGNGGFAGEGFLNGSQLRGKYIPEQHTDYIFTTIAEQFGWLGSTVFLLLYLLLIIRLFFLAERQKNRFSRVVGYSLASLLSFHLFLNVMMVLGLFPTIGIPIPFVSYGGTSLWIFSIFLFLFLKLDAHRVEEW